MTATSTAYHEPEITAPVDLVGGDGKLNRAAVAWSRRPLHRCNLPATLERKKKWNYWAVTCESFLFSATIADVDRAQTAGAYLFERKTQRHLDLGAIVAPGTITMPEYVAGDIAIDHRRLRVAMTDEGAGTRIRVDAPDFGGMPLRADILIERPAGHETLGVVIPWSDTVFQYTSKQNTLPASGYVQVGGDRLELRAPAFGCLDYGRGVWPEHTIWNWGSASGVQGGRTVGLNLGDKWTDGTGMNENAICVDGRLTKISEDLVWEYDRADWMKPWRIRTAASDRIDLLFKPEYDRASMTGRRETWFTEAHQMFGRYAGRITPDGGEPVELRDLFGWAEEHEARW
jgi:hypothetical protein